MDAAESWGSITTIQRSQWSPKQRRHIRKRVEYATRELPCLLSHDRVEEFLSDNATRRHGIHDQVLGAEDFPIGSSGELGLAGSIEFAINVSIQVQML
jgi:hypothetical protein